MFVKYYILIEYSTLFWFAMLINITNLKLSIQKEFKGCVMSRIDSQNSGVASGKCLVGGRENIKWRSYELIICLAEI